MPRLFHLDTDIAGDIDDLCALALLLRSQGEARLTGITTVAELDGQRAGYVRYVLGLEGKEEIPTAAGADNKQGFYPYPLGLPPAERYWPEAIPPYPTPMSRAIHVLKESIQQGAAVIGIGPYTNLCLLERQYPGILMETELYLMGGYLYPTRTGYPNWGNAEDFNVQIDVESARYVLEHSRATLIPLSVTVETALRRSQLAALEEAGTLGRLIAHQARAFADDENIAERLGPVAPALPVDIINFQHDPLACSVAMGWNGVEIEELPLAITVEEGLLVERVHPGGIRTRVVTRVDGSRFDEYWLARVTGR